MLRKEVPPPAPAVMPSMSRPASLNMPFSIATAQGSVATSRPYWLTVILAARAGAAATAVMASASVARNHMVLPPVFMCVDRTGRCVSKACTLGFLPPARSPQDASAENPKFGDTRPEERHEDRARRPGRREDPHPAASP